MNHFAHHKKLQMIGKRGIALLLSALLLAASFPVTAAAEEAAVITGFAPFDVTGHYLSVNWDNRAPLEDLVAMMPASLDVYLNGSTESTSVPVTWYAVDDDYATTGAMYLQFSPRFAEPYAVSGSIDILTEAPYIGVFLIQNEATGDEAMMGGTNPDEVMNTATVSKYTYTSSPYEYKIFEYLTDKLGFSTAAAVGIMANICCESSFYPNNLQNNGNKELNMTDDQYTQAVDNGTYGNFINDKYGYGLIQWTYWTRKRNLLDFARAAKVSISDYAMQLNFMNKELNAGYVQLRSTLGSVPNTADGAYNAAHDWCYYFEQPGNYPAVSVTRGNLAKNNFWEIYKNAGFNYSTTYERICGNNRYATAIAAADRLLKIRGAKSFNSIVLASATNYPDALSGVALASQLEAPILLVNADDSHTGTQQTLAYINKKLVSDGRVYLLGGNAAVSGETETSLKKSGYKVTRLGGANRYETNMMIVDQMIIGNGSDVYIATGQNFADALSISGISGYRSAPVILVKDELTESALKKIAEIAPETIYILGSPVAVPENVEKQLADYPTVVRIGGSNRYNTAVLTADALANPNAKDAVIVTGMNFPDGLVAGLIAAELNIPILLVSDTSSSATAAYAKKKGITNYFVMGGDAAVPPACVRGLMR